MSKATQNNTIIAIDIETTGLIPSEGVILEVACFELDEYLNERSSLHVIIDSDLPENTSEEVVQMHMDNGLLYSAPTGTLQDVAKYLMQFEKIIFLGSSVNFDKRWIEYHLPEVIPHLHYRVIDVSSFVELFDLRDKQRKETSHRAVGDIRYSIKVAKLYRDVLKTGRHN